MFCQCSFGVILTVIESRAHDEPYYEYVPDRRSWKSAAELCNQRSGALATVSRPSENQELTSFLKSLKINQTVWIDRNVSTHWTSRFTLPLYALLCKHICTLDPLDFTVLLAFKDTYLVIKQCWNLK